MTKHELVRKELKDLYKEGAKLAEAFGEEKENSFHYSYQRWYSKALKAVGSLAPDRYPEFKSYYEIDPKRKTLGYGSFVIQDFMKGVVPATHRIPDFNARSQTLICFLNQLTILKSIESRVDSVLANIEGELYAELQDNELGVATQLAKINIRAAGALVGVVIEGHLQKLATAYGVKLSKKNPTIADLNDPLKAAGVVDMPGWRKISYLADIRNLCSHKKGTEPTKEQVEELIQGAGWLTKNVF